MPSTIRNKFRNACIFLPADLCVITLKVIMQNEKNIKNSLGKGYLQFERFVLYLESGIFTRIMIDLPTLYAGFLSGPGGETILKIMSALSKGRK